MHIPDGVLSNPVVITTGVLAAGGVANGLRKIDYERVPRVAVLAAVFFVASLIHVPIGPASSHLLLNGLLGFLIGWAAFPALLVALLLQAVFFGFGGVTSLGANVLNMAAPAVVAYYLFTRQISLSSSPKKVFGLAFVAGAFAILLTCLFGSMTLFFSGKEFVGAITAIFIAHIPVMIIEGFVTGSVMIFLHKVRPELLGAPLLNVEYEKKVYA
jgi:cobalt/nickel transport system permease protein